MTALHDLAAAAGLQREWTDAMGEAQCVSDAALTGILGALGLSADSDEAIAESRRRLEDEADACCFLSADAGQPIALPRAFAGQRAELRLEDGDVQPVTIGADARLPAIETAGYHQLEAAGRSLTLAVAPTRCFSVEDAAPGRRIWAGAVQIASLRDERRTAYGDFGALAEASRAFAGAGADALAISPVHALFPADPDRYSPYAPSSRLFLNILYADPRLAGGTLADEPSPDLIDWRAAIPARVAALRRLFDAAPEAIRRRADAYAEQKGEELERHARFDALHAHFFATGARGWQDWPAEYHDPAGSAVASFAAQHEQDVAFYRFLQWLAAESLDAAQRAARDGGMALGLIADLAVGMDAGGSHAWSRPDDLLTGLSIGAPPDLLGPDGQNWGITGFDPRALRRTGFAGFIATVRAALAHAGGIRIDHALGLHRLWVVPDGASPKDGAFLVMPQDDLLRLLALESQRARAIVIGEDLGTVPEGLRPAMDARAMLGMRVLWFERDDSGFLPPARWSPQAAAMTTTHDLPTVAGWWRGRDIDWTWELGRTSRAADEAEDRAKRAQERTELWHAFTQAGVTDAPAPPPADTNSAVDAAVAYVGETPCELAIVPIEDIAGLIEQPNLPGTIDEHPNWRRRMAAPTDALLAEPAAARRLAILNEARTA